MKKIFTVVCLLICVNMYAQKCSDYLFLQNNKTVEMTIYNKKGEENGKQIYTGSNVTTTAGTWDCFKISYKSKMVIKTAGIGIPINIDGTEWYAAGVGVVKTQSKSGGTAITAIK